MQREQPEDADGRNGPSAGDAKARTSVHAAPGAVRRVGPNPILWREITPGLTAGGRCWSRRLTFVVLCFICWYALAPLSCRHQRMAFGRRLRADSRRRVLSLLLVAAQAVTAITSERDTGALDLLLVTDLTPKEFIFGKLGGIAYNTKEYLLPPLLLAGVYACLRLPRVAARRPPGTARGDECDLFSLYCLAPALVLLAFAMVLGIHVALRTPNSRVAIINTLSTIFFLSVGTLVCIALILINGRFEYQWGSFVFFLVAGVGGLWWVLSGDRPSGALTWASWFCPLAVLYTVMNILVAKPGSQGVGRSAHSVPGDLRSFGFAVAAMLVPLLSEFDVAMGRTSGGAD